MANVFNPVPQEIAGNVQTVAPVTDRSGLIKEQMALQNKIQTNQTIQQGLDLVLPAVGMIQQHRATKAANEFTGGVDVADEILPDPQGLDGLRDPEERAAALDALDNMDKLGAARKAGAISWEEFRMKSGVLLRESKQNSPYAKDAINAAYQKIVYGQGSGSFREKSAKETAAATREAGIQKLMPAFGNDRVAATKGYDAAISQQARNALYQQNLRDGTVSSSTIYRNIDENASGIIMELSQNISQIHARGQGVTEQERQGILNSMEAGIRALEEQKRRSIQAFSKSNPGALFDVDTVKQIDQRIAGLRGITENMLKNKSTADFTANLIKEVDNMQEIGYVMATGIGPKMREGEVGKKMLDYVAFNNQAAITNLRNNPATAPLVDMFTSGGSTNFKALSMNLKLGALNTVFAKPGDVTATAGTAQTDGSVAPPLVEKLSTHHAAALMADNYASPRSADPFAAVVDEGGEARKRYLSIYQAHPEGVTHLNKPEYQALVIKEPAKYQSMFNDAMKTSIAETQASTRGADIGFRFVGKGIQLKGVPDANNKRVRESINAQYNTAKVNPFIYQQAGFDTAEDYIRSQYGAMTTNDAKDLVKTLPQNVKASLQAGTERTLRKKDLITAWEKDSDDILGSERRSLEQFLREVTKPENQDIMYSIFDVNPESSGSRLRGQDSLKALNALKKKLGID